MTSAGIAVVTGATGHIGNNLARALLDRERAVRVVSRRPREEVTSLAGLDVEWVVADVADVGALTRAFTGATTVFHAAGRVSLASGDGPRLRAVNVQGVEHVVAACAAAGDPRLVHFSSLNALSPFPLDAPVDESRPASTYMGAPPYDRSKAEGEAVVLRAAASGLDAVVVNPTGVIGPFDFGPSRIGRLLARVWTRGLPVIVAGGMDWVDVRDVVAGALAAEAQGRAGERYILSGRWASLHSLVAEAAGLARRPPPRVVLPGGATRAIAPLAELAARAVGADPTFTASSVKAVHHYRDVSSARAVADLGYAPRPLSETLLDTHAWFVEQRVLQAT